MLRNFKCCKNKDFTNFCCVVCSNIFHASCLERINGSVKLGGYKIFCSVICQDKYNEDHEKEKQNMEIIQQLKSEIHERDIHIARQKRNSEAFDNIVTEAETKLTAELERQNKQIQTLQKDCGLLKQSEADLKDKLQNHKNLEAVLNGRIEELTVINKNMIITIDTLERKNESNIKDLKELNNKLAYLESRKVVSYTDIEDSLNSAIYTQINSIQNNLQMSLTNAIKDMQQFYGRCMDEMYNNLIKNLTNSNHNIQFNTPVTLPKSTQQDIPRNIIKNNVSNEGVINQAPSPISPGTYAEAVNSDMVKTAVASAKLQNYINLATEPTHKQRIEVSGGRRLEANKQQPDGSSNQSNPSTSRLKPKHQRPETTNRSHLPNSRPHPPRQHHDTPDCSNIPVSRPNINNRPAPQKGTNDKYNTLKAAQQPYFNPNVSWVFLSGFSTDTTSDSIIEYVRNGVGLENCLCEKLVTRKDQWKSSFKLGVPKDDLEQVMAPGLWPLGTIFNHFMNVRRNPTTK